jgi:hypothetical protein
VTVNGATAQVANRTFLTTDVPLSLGSNVIQAVGRDRVGNAGTTQVTVTRQAPGQQAQIRLFSGNNQAGMIGALLPAPLVVALTDATGNPVPNQPVIFKVTQNDGMVAAGGPPTPSVIAMTNVQGQAQVQWTLGARAGAGANAMEAYAVGFSGMALFTATGTQGPAGNIVVDSGNDQIGAVNQPLPRPLIAVVVDSGNNRLAGVPVTFTVIEGGGSFAGQPGGTDTADLTFTVTQNGTSFAGQPSITVTTDSDGRAAATWTLGPQEGHANNLVEASFPSNQGFPAAFTASGRVSGDPAQTTISGVVLDNSNVPIPGVTIRAVLTNILKSNVSALQAVAAVQTDTQGQFLISQAPVGFVKLLVDGSTAQLPGQYPLLEYDLVTIAGQNNTVGMPVYLLPLNTNNQLCVTATTGGGTLTIPEAPGFSLTFGPGQVTFPGGSKTGCVSVTVVHGDKVPMVPGFGQQPRFIVTIQPAGAAFNPPAPITLPNVDGLQPRAMTEMYSFDHDIGSFVAIGTGTVSDDGLVIRSNTGVGVLKAGWHCGGNPSTTGTVAKCPQCNRCQTNVCVADNSQVPKQTQAHDCQKEICRGGSVTSMPDDADVPIDECKVCANGAVKDVECPECQICQTNGCEADDSQVPKQTQAHDCQKEICRGGSVTSMPDDADVPIDECKVCANGAVKDEDGISCNDKQFCTENDQCKTGRCEGQPKPDQQGLSGSVAVNLDKAFDSVKGFLRTLFGDSAPDFSLQIAGSVGNVTQCCEKKQSNETNKNAQLGGAAGIQGEFPIPGIALPLPFNLGKAGLFVAISLSTSGTLGAQENKCEDRLEGTLSGQVQLAGGVKAQLKTPPSVANISIGGTTGLSGGIVGTVIPGKIQGQFTGGHNGLIASATVQLVDGLIEATGNLVLIQPGSLLPVHLTIPFTL